ncbi:ATPase [Planctomicrobium sp. SH664]|uniref:ATPase n=1 Tax=Planctomicrobium sp. SH664 TaxID=3448125 RepID=UPI003F5C134F
MQPNLSAALPLDDSQQVVDQLKRVSELVAAAQQTEESFAPPDMAVAPPAAPKSLHEADLHLGQISNLILKLLYLHGMLRGYEISRNLKLPFSVADEGLEFLKGERCVEVTSGDLMGRLSYRYLLTEAGRVRAREAFEECRYVGPAPVSLEQYSRQCRVQSIRHLTLTPQQLQHSLRELIVDADLVQRLGPAVNGGQAIFLHGPPGNGKTVIGRAIGRLLNHYGGEIYVPYAISVDSQIISVFDPAVHRTSEEAGLTGAAEEAVSPDAAEESQFDARWRKVRRPFLVSGGELSLEQLDLKFHAGSGFYTAPIHVKANGGVFLLDDFGRQLVPPRQLLNRWILPLEERVDFLTLVTGKKFAVPFEQLIIFSTNLAPAELVDAAFLRRIRHKVEIGHPTERQYRDIFRKCCEQRGIRYDDWLVTQLFETRYHAQNPPKSSDPRDLLDVVDAICRFRNEKPHLSEKILLEAFQECLGGIQIAH